MEQRPVRWVLRQEPVVLCAVVLFALLAWMFFGIAEEVVEGDTHIADRIMLRMLRDPDDQTRMIGPPWLGQAAMDFTALGSAAVVSLMIAAVLGFLLLTKRWATALLVFVAIVGGWGLSTALKHGFDRPRPDLVPELTKHLNPSFPSGHAMTAAIVYLTLAALLASTMERKRERFYVICVAVVLTLLVGLTRIFLGVHYPTDVAAGWCVGGAWASLCWVTARVIRTKWGERLN